MTDAQTELHEQIAIESTGHKPTDEERRQKGIAWCREQIEHYERTIAVLEAEKP